MATGFKSNYNDSGYNVPSTGSYYGGSGQLITTGSIIASSDVYNNSQQVGVYMFDGNQGNRTAVIYPIFSSLSNMNILGIPNGADDAWLVYPGYGFQLFNGANYTGTKSNTYINNTSNPVLFTTTSGGIPGSTLIKTDSEGTYSANTTFSVKIYFRFQQINISPIS
jgi:hypothetical protein